MVRARRGTGNWILLGFSACRCVLARGELRDFLILALSLGQGFRLRRAGRGPLRLARKGAQSTSPNLRLVEASPLRRDGALVASTTRSVGEVDRLA
jgi:hypothetical protein